MRRYRRGILLLGYAIGIRPLCRGTSINKRMGRDAICNYYEHLTLRTE